MFVKSGGIKNGTYTRNCVSRPLPELPDFSTYPTNYVDEDGAPSLCL